MSTRARIGVVLSKGEVLSIYNHWDGYPEGVGAILTTNYVNEEKIRKLISLGDISSLGGTLDETKSYFGWREENTPPRRDANIDDFLDSAFNCGEEYVYLWKENNWYFTDGYEYKGQLRLLNTKLEED